jgi:23S rRNA pseudouridine1911/1915/1917 synthase
LKFQVLYEDNHLLVIDKPAGWVVQGAQPSDQSILSEARSYLARKYNKPGQVYLGVVSRLDRAVTGVVPLARTSKAAARLSEQLRQRDVRKIYWALVAGATGEAQGSLQHWLSRDERAAKTLCYSQPRPGAAEAVLHYRCLAAWPSCRLLEIELETGRKHQIRTQLAAIGCSILGDARYGSKIAWKLDAIALHCKSLTFEHPTLRQAMTFSAKLPQLWLDRLPAPWQNGWELSPP